MDEYGYEYAVAVRVPRRNKDQVIDEDEWGTLDEARIELYELQMMSDRRVRRDGSTMFEYRIVKRRKAGAIEEMDE